MISYLFPVHSYKDVDPLTPSLNLLFCIFESCGDSLGYIDWAEQVQTLLRLVIQCKRTVTNYIVQAEFQFIPFVSNAFSNSTFHLHRLRFMGDYTMERSKSLNGQKHWHSKASCLLQLIGISIDKLPHLNYSLNAPSQPLP